MLLHLNGPPAVGKSTVARLLAERRPLAMALDIDAIRVTLGQWQSLPDSKRIARARGFELAAAHLRDGFDVVLPQLTVLVDVPELLERIAVDAGASFAEVLLLAPKDELVRRFRAGRGGPHPADDVGDIDALLDDTAARLDALVAVRPGVLVVDASGSPADVARAVEAALT